jgi:hypothetical protein
VTQIRAMAVLAACERVIKDWPVAARIAFRHAVLDDVTQFVDEEWDAVTPQIRAEIFFARWERGLPWPPDPAELERPDLEAPTVDLEAVGTLARRICALGVELARASR